MEQQWETMQSWNAQIPVGWAGREGLLYDREEATSPVYDEPVITGTAINSNARAQARLCACGCGSPTPKRNSEYLSYVPGHRKAKKHW